MRCGRFCMGCFVFWRRGLVGCVLLQRGRRRKLRGIPLSWKLLLLFVRFLRLLLKVVAGRRSQVAGRGLLFFLGLRFCRGS